MNEKINEGEKKERKKERDPANAQKTPAHHNTPPYHTKHTTPPPLQLNYLTQVTPTPPPPTHTYHTPPYHRRGQARKANVNKRHTTEGQRSQGRGISRNTFARCHGDGRRTFSPFS